MVFSRFSHTALFNGPMKVFQNYIDGRFVRGSREFPDVNPADGSVIAQVSEADRSQVNDAVSAAASAVQGGGGSFRFRNARLFCKELRTELRPGFRSLSRRK